MLIYGSAVYGGSGQMSVKYIEEAGKSFAFAAEPVEYQRCDAGHINDTYFVSCGEGNPKYIMQRVNTDIFKDPIQLMSNIKGVCLHVAKKIEAAGGDPDREVRKIIETKSGDDYYVDPDGRYWRAYLMIEDVISYNTPDSCLLYTSVLICYKRGDYKRRRLVRAVVLCHCLADKTYAVKL